MANSTASTSSASVPSTASSPGPSISQRGTLSRIDSVSTLGSSPNPRRPRGLSDASSLTIGSNSTLASGIRPFKARRLPALPPASGNSLLTSTISEHDVLQYVSRPEEVDLLALSHESIPSLFVHFGVQDVRTIQQRARTEASKKQTELRTMVGERYRDLLGAADSIVRMRHSSEHLLRHLGQAKRDCTQEHMQRRSRAFSKQPSHSKTASVAELSGEPVHHSLAMLIKLLLDSPEHIWRALEAQDALSAARLAMLARVVYRELASMSLSDEQAENAHDQGREKTPDVFMAFPIAEKQWDTLSQLATQVVRRAKADLQRWQVSDQATSHSLAAILLLDNTPLNSLLQMLLTARQTAFHDLLSAQDPQTLALQEKIDHITRAMRLIATTLAQAQELVNPQGLLFSTVDRLQAPNIASATQDASSAALQPIIDSLPNAHLYHRYLPATVTTFTPFIDVSSPPSSDQINSATKEWFTAAETRFRKALGQTLEAISDASALANFKRNMHSFFQSPNMSDEMRRLHDLVEEFCLARLESVYQSSLTHLVSATSDQWASALDHLSENQVEIDSAAFLFSDLPPPDSSAFDALDSALQKRLDGRSPLLDQCLTCFEVLCDHLRSDLSDWFGPDLLKGKDSEDKLRQGYGTALANALADMKTQFDALMNQGYQPLFMLRLWHALAHSKQSFLILTTLDDAFAPKATDFETALGDLVRRSKDLWLEAVTTDALALSETVIASASAQTLVFERDYFIDTDSKGLRVATQPTAGTLAALVLLARRLEQVDHQILSDSPELPLELMKLYQSRWIQTLDAPDANMDNDTVCALLWDCILLDRLHPLDTSHSALSLLLKQMGRDISWSEVREASQTSIEQFCIRSQNVLLPLRSKERWQDFKAQRASTLLPLGVLSGSSIGASTTTTGAPKLGARFGLLPVSNAHNP